MRLVENHNPRMSQPFHDHLLKYADTSYGIPVDQHALCQDVRRIPVGFIAFDIVLDDDSIAGHIDLVPQADDPRKVELLIAVFDNFSGQGIATDAIRILLQSVVPNRFHKVLATVRPENEEDQIIIHILTQCGFVGDDYEGCFSYTQ